MSSGHRAPRKARAYDFSADALQGNLINALPSLAPASAGKPAPTRDSEIVRKAHDQARDVLQTH